MSILEQTSSDQLKAVILVNLGICHHLCRGKIEDATQYYELAIQSSGQFESKIVQVVCWNNLLNIFSNDLLEEKLARYCFYEIEQIICERDFLHLFSRMKWPDWRGIFFNLLLFSSSGNLAPAA